MNKGKASTASELAKSSVRLPSWLQPKPGKNITTSGGKLKPDHVALLFMISIDIHNSADALRKLARRLVPQVCMEQQPRMNRLSRIEDDAKLFEEAWALIDRVDELLQARPFISKASDKNARGVQ